MAARMLIILFCFSLTGSAQDKEPPYSKPPKLENLFTDDFQEDSRGDYESSGKKDAVQWETGKLTLGDGAILQRELNAGSWVEIEVEIEFPRLTNDGETSELKVWLDMEGAFDSFVWFRQKRENESNRSAVFIVDAEGDWRNSKTQKRISQPLAIYDDLKNIKVTVRYQEGLYTVSISDPNKQVFGVSKKGGIPINRLVLTSTNAKHVVKKIKTAVDTRVELSTEAIAIQKEFSPLMNQARKHFRSGQFSIAASILEKFRTRQKSTIGRYNHSYVSTLNNLALLYKSSGSLKKAESIYLDCLAISKAKFGEMHPFYATSLNNLANLYAQLNEFSKAESLYREAITIRQKLFGPKHQDYATSLGSLALLYHSMGRYKEAESLLIKTKAIQEEVLGKKHLLYFTTLNNLAEVYQAVGKFEEAKPLYLSAISGYGDVLGKRHPDYATSLNNLAALYKSTGDYAQAESFYSRAKTIREEVVGKRHPDYAQSVNNLAFLYDLIGEHQKASLLHIEAVELRRTLLGNQHPLYAQSLTNLARHYMSIAEYKKAMPLFEEALRIREKKLGKTHPDYADSLDAVAYLHELSGDYENAENHLLNALSIVESSFGRGHPRYARVLNNLAALYYTIEKYKKAEALYLQAIEIRQKTLEPLHPDYADSIGNLASLYLAMGKLPLAKKYFLQANEIHEKILNGSHPAHEIHQYNLGGLHFLAREFDQAERFLIKSLQSSRNKLEKYSSIQSERLQRQYAKSFEYRLSALISNTLHHNGSKKLVWKHVLAWKGMSLIRQKRNRILAQYPATSSSYRNLQLIKSQLSKLVQENPNASGWKAQWDSLVAKEEKLEKELASLAAKIGIVSSANLSNDISLPNDSCLIDFRRFTFAKLDPDRAGRFHFEPHYLGMVLTQEREIHLVDLGSAKAIETATEIWRQSIQVARPVIPAQKNLAQRSGYEAGINLRKLIWDPLEKHIGDSKLILVSPDAALGRVPLIALPGISKGKFLLEEKRIVYLPVPGLLPQLLSNKPNEIDLNVDALVIGNVDYGTDSGTKTSQLKQTNEKLLGDLKFLRIPGTKAEIDGIRSRLENVTSLTDVSASEKEFRRLSAERRLLHIATHGFFKSPDQYMTRIPKFERTESVFRFGESTNLLNENPNLLSGLALAHANLAASKSIDEGANDGILFSAEIAMLPLQKTELAVLSACDTGLGVDDSPGEGLIGIQRAFQVAGAKSTIASYWKVDDRATQLLMNKFYENLLEYSKKAKKDDLRNNQTTIRIDALRDAQLWMLNNPIVASATNRGDPIEVDPKKITKAESGLKPADKKQRTHPRYWAAFMLSGDWR